MERRTSGQDQEESFYYEQQKESGRYPIVGVNTFLEGRLAVRGPQSAHPIHE
jgi:hypothetical protein